MSSVWEPGWGFSNGLPLGTGPALIQSRSVELLARFPVFAKPWFKTGTPPLGVGQNTKYFRVFTCKRCLHGKIIPHKEKVTSWQSSTYIYWSDTNKSFYLT